MSNRCQELHPRSTRESQCERPAGHAGDHLATSYSGNIKIYPSKWTTYNEPYQGDPGDENDYGRFSDEGGN